MGLDMYLEAEQYVSDYDVEDEALVDAIKHNVRNSLGGFRPTNIRFELAYWRKANAVHGWFVKNVQGGKDECQRSYVSLDQLKELKDTCEKVLGNIELAEELLPSTKGFFFGHDLYDEYYVHQLQQTVEKLEKVLSNPDSKKWWITYTSSW